MTDAPPPGRPRPDPQVPDGRSSPDPLVLRIPDPSLVVLVGAAGAGKSTFAARHFAPEEILSSDAFRGRISGDPADQRATRPAFAALHRSLERRLAARALTVVDATNVRPHARRALVARAEAAGVPAVAIVLDLPPAVVLARNAARSGGAAVPEDAVLGHLADLAAWIGHGDGQDPRPGRFRSVLRLTSPRDVERVVVERVSTSSR